MHENRVELEYNDGCWIVRIIDGGEVIERSFIFMQGARAYAEGQAYRLTGKLSCVDKTKAF